MIYDDDDFLTHRLLVSSTDNFCKQFGPRSRHKFEYSKTCVKWLLSKGPKIGFQDQLSLNAGQKYCRMHQGEHSAILSTFIMLPFVIKIFVLSIFEWPFYTCFEWPFYTCFEWPFYTCGFTVVEL